MYRSLTTLFGAITLLLSSVTLSKAAVSLMMAEEPGCIYCARWIDEIGPIYPKTGEGAAAPLRRVDISDPIPADITLARRVTFTPTFILLKDGVEVQRLEGYPGEDFFWGLLGMMLDQADVPYSVNEASIPNEDS